MPWADKSLASQSCLSGSLQNVGAATAASSVKLLLLEGNWMGVLRGKKGVFSAGAECHLHNGSTKAWAHTPYDVSNVFRGVHEDIKYLP